MRATYIATITLPSGPRGAKRSKIAIVTSTGADLTEAAQIAELTVRSKFRDATAIHLKNVSLLPSSFEVVRG